MNSVHHRAARGFSLIEVMIAVVILSFGLLALAAFQGTLMRAGAEAKARATATALAQQIIEEGRSFAYVAKPTEEYAGATYADTLVSFTGRTITSGGVSYTINRTVSRYSPAGVPITAAFDPGTPEFKLVTVDVSWTGSDGAAKTVTIDDAVASVAPADSMNVVKGATDTMGGPQVWIEPPNKGNPQVVPIAVGGDQSAASSNPKPEQFVQDVSAATLFSVQTFTGDVNGDEVQLNRKLDVAAVSCVCSAGGARSTSSNPAYQVTVWNGKQLAYMDPQPAPVGTPIGTPVVSNSAPEIEAMCTVCCRDHHETSKRQPRPDPYRALTTEEAAGAEHYGYQKQGNSYRVGLGLLPAGTQTGGLYVDACQLIRVGGQMRLAVDAQQNQLMVTPLNDAKTAFRQDDFISRYSSFVLDHVTDGMAALPAGYPGPNARFPAPSDARLSQYADIVTPSAIDLGAEGSTKKLVAFGLYIDYLSPDTIKAYNCARTGSNAGECAGLGDRNPLVTLPLYAVNVANLGSWESAKAGVGSVVNATYSHQGLLSADGGTVTAERLTSTDAFPISLTINNSNSGLASTWPVDPDDRAESSFVTDAQAFVKPSGTSSPGSRNSVFVRVGSSSTLSLSTILVTSPAGGTQCTYANKTGTSTCRFDSPASSLTIGFTNYTTTSKVRGSTVINNRKICIPSDNRVVSITVSNDGQTSDTTTVSLVNLAAVDYTLTIDVVDQATACPSGTAPLTP